MEYRATCTVTVVSTDVSYSVSELLVGVLAYPNPFGEGLALQHASREVRYELVDASGRLALHGADAGREELRLATRALSAGFYMLCLMDANGGVRTLRLMKQ